MNLLNVYSKVIKVHSKRENVTVITNFDNTSVLLKYVLSLPDTYIGAIDIADESQNGYNYVYVLTIHNNGEVFCEPAIRENSTIARSGGICLIDAASIGDTSAEEFVFADCDTKVKIINID